MLQRRIVRYASIIVSSLFVSVFLCAFAPLRERSQSLAPYKNPNLPIEQRVADLMSRLTLEEKVAQMMNATPAIERLGVPAHDYWNEALHGVARSGIATVFPQAIGLAATWDTKLMYEVAGVISTEARAKHHEYARNNQFGRYQGLTFWSPNINIFRDPRWGRGQETYGEDPYLTGRLGTQFVRGLQGDDPRYFKVIATPKHYAVHSGPEPERHAFDAIASERDLRETYLPAFRDTIVEGKAYSVMCAYNRTNGEPCCANKRLMVDILRGEWGFDGYVVSDCGAIYDIWKFHQVVPTVWSYPGLSERLLEEAVKAARESDVSVLVLGISARLEGEEMPVHVEGFRGGDRTDLSLPKSQEALLKAVAATGKPVVVVLLSGSAVAVNWANHNVPAILAAWYPGGEGGTAVADVLFGDYNPAGRLPVTFYKSVDQLPPFTTLEYRRSLSAMTSLRTLRTSVPSALSITVHMI